MKLQKEEQILDEDFRKDVIEEILDEENQTRKMREKKRYDVYKDGTRKYVLKDLKKNILIKTASRMLFIGLQTYLFLEKL